MSGPHLPGIGLPIGLPSAWSNDALLSQVRASSAAVTGTNTLPDSSYPSRRVSGSRLARLAENLATRDWRILRLVAAHRYLSTRQVEEFCFHDHASVLSGARSARRVLRRLARDNLLRSLQRRVGGVRAGSASYIWQLAPGGARLLKDLGETYRTHEPSIRFLEHCLAIAEVHLVITRLHRTHDLEDAEVQLEPDCWRAYSGLGGERRLLRPDLYLRTVSTTYEDRWFIEVDRGTESLPTLLKKCSLYEAYRASGQEQSASGVFPLVVWQMPNAARADQLRQRIIRSHSLTPELYRVVTPDELIGLLAGDES